MKLRNIYLLVLLFVIPSLIFGNKNSEARKINSFSVVGPPASSNRNGLFKKTASFEVTWKGTWTDKEKKAAKKALEFWENILIASNPITVELVWKDLGEKSLGNTVTKFTEELTKEEYVGYKYPRALAKQLGPISNPKSPDMIITMNSKQQWSYSVNSVPVKDKFDFITVLLHEVAHGLGIDGKYFAIGSETIPLETLDDKPAIFDKFIFEGDTQIISIVDNNEIQSALTSDNLVFNGVNAKIANLEECPSLYAPRQWKKGSSIYHLGESFHDSRDRVNSLMCYAQSYSEVVHDPGPVLLGILEDLGWGIDRNISLITPIAGGNYIPGSELTIEWYDYHPGEIDKISIDLLKKENNIDIPMGPVAVSIQSKTGHKSIYSWSIPSGLNEGKYILEFKGGTSQIASGRSEVFNLSTKPNDPYFIPGPGVFGKSIAVNCFCTTPESIIKYSYSATGTFQNYDSPIEVKSSKNLYIKSIVTLKSGEIKESNIVEGKFVIDNKKEQFEIKGVTRSVNYDGSCGGYLNNVVMIGKEYRSYIKFSDVGKNIPRNTVIDEVELYLDFPGLSGIKYFVKDFTIPSYESLKDYYDGIGNGEKIAEANSDNESVLITNSKLKEKLQKILRGESNEDIIIGLQNSDETSGTNTLITYSEPILILQVTGNVKVDQVSSGKESFGNVAYYRDSKWNERRVPYYLREEVGSEICLQASKEFRPNSTELMHDWVANNITSNVNFGRFKVKEKNSFKSVFKNTATNVTIQNRIEGYTNIDNPDNLIAFKDPWLADYLDPKTNTYRNREKPVYKSLRSPICTGNGGYRGFFINEDLTSENHYRIKVYDKISILDHECLFRELNSVGAEKIMLNVSENEEREACIIFKENRAVITANYKGLHLTNTSSAISNNGQRKSLFWKGKNFLVYESMGNIWLEKKEIGATEWVLANERKPINFEEKGNASKPSIGGIGSNNNMFVVTYYEDGELWIAYIDPAGNLIGTYENVEWRNLTVGNPQVVNIGIDRTVLVVWQHNGLRYKYGRISEWGIDWEKVGIIPGTSVKSQNPSLATYSRGANPIEFHLAWEEPVYNYARKCSTNAVKYVKIKGNEIDVSFSNWASFTEGSGPGRSYKSPKITVPNGIPVLAWLAKSTMNNQDEVIVCSNNGSSWGNYREYMFSPYSSTIKSCDINSDETNHIVLAFSGNGKSKYVKDITSYSMYSFPYAGDYLDISNGYSLENIGITSFNPGTTPKKLETKFIGGALSKGEQGESYAYREALIFNNNAKLSLRFGDITVDNEAIFFEEVPTDSGYTTVTDIGGINEYLLSKPFVLKDGDSFGFAVETAIVDTTDDKLFFSGDNAIGYTIGLIDAVTGKVIGEYEKGLLSRKSLKETFGNFSVNTKGIGDREVRLKLTLTSTKDYECRMITTIYAERSGLEKENVKHISYNGENVVKDYSLSQNYPNPFNPTTTINYQLPKAGRVSLKVYDVLGKEVATLVNDIKESGRYEVRFDASNLASGVYIYTIRANDYVSSKKMILIK